MHILLYTCIEREPVDCEELAQVIMEPEETEDLQLASWIPKTAGGGRSSPRAGED